MTPTSFNPNWLIFYGLSLAGQTFYNRYWTTNASQTESEKKVQDTAQEIFDEDLTDAATHEAVCYPMKENPPMRDLVAQQQRQQYTYTAPIVQGISAAVMSNVMSQLMQDAPIPMVPPLTLASTMNAQVVRGSPVKTLVSKALTVPSKALVQRPGLLSRLSQRTETYALPLLGAPFATGTTGTTGGSFFSTMYGYAGSAFNTADSYASSAYGAASSAASSAWASVGWRTTLSLGATGVLGLAYLANRYLRSSGVTVINNNYPVNKNESHTHLHFDLKEGTKVTRTTDEEGNIHYTVRTDKPRLRKIVHGIMKQRARKAATAA